MNMRPTRIREVRVMAIKIAASGGASIASVIATIVAGVLAVLCAQACLHTTAVAQALKVDDIIAKANEARGGDDKMRSMKTVKLTGKITVQGVLEGKCVLYLKRPHSIRLESTVQGFTIIQGYDGATETAWVQNPLVGALEPRKANPNETKQAECQALMFDGDLFEHKEKSKKVQLLSKESVEIVTNETIEGFTAYKVKVTRKNGDVVTMYLDANTFLPMKQTVKVPTSNGVADLLTLQRSFRPVNNVLVPYAIEQTLGGKPYVKMVFEKVEANPVVDDALFALPAPK
jgi:hypothetical protein